MADIWLPDASSYLDRADNPQVRPGRPVFQGDVFRNVPMAMSPRYKENLNEGTEYTAKRCTVMAFSHPCGMTKRDGSLKELQTVARVIPADRAGCADWEHPWSGRFPLYPLPGLVDGQLYIADFTQLGTTNANYLRESRIACLSFDGWAGMLWRIDHLFSRQKANLSLLKELNTALWHEINLHEKWVAHTGSEDGFQEFLSEESRSRAPAKRREALSGAPDEIEAEFPRGG